jgi:hypothetical protein
MWEYVERWNHSRDLAIGGRKYLKWILKEVLCDDMCGINMDQDRDQ